MNQTHNREITEALEGEGTGVRFEPLSGGFTQAEKYVVTCQTPEGPKQLFAKVVDAQNQLESRVLDAEATHYQSLAQLRLTGRYFPGFHTYVRTEQTRALLIDYLPETTWGGPWTLENTQKLFDSISAIHAVDVPEGQKKRIRYTADSLMNYLYKESPNTLNDDDYARLFEHAWSSGKSHVVNSRGQQYFNGNAELYEEIKDCSARYDKRAGERIQIRDVNFNNIGVTADGVVFVDPAYLDIGNPASDMVGLGLNVLLVTPDDEEHLAVRQFVKDKFIADNKFALARTIQSLLAVGTLEYGEVENPWMDYHQQMAETALRAWHDLI
ncbi:MAG: hypothetical protein WA843_03685 [Candidatus Saccharimonadales bacterium]